MEISECCLWYEQYLEHQNDNERDKIVFIRKQAYFPMCMAELSNGYKTKMVHF